MNIDNFVKLLYSEDIMAQTKKKSEHYVNNKEFWPLWLNTKVC